MDVGQDGCWSNNKSHKSRLCKKFNTEGGCPFGDQCTLIHDKEPRSRESTAIVLGTSSNIRYRNGGTTGSVGPAATPPLPLAPVPARPPAVPLPRVAESEIFKPMNWRKRICKSWEQGYCSFGSKCVFAHGEAELLRYNGGTIDILANPTNQGVPNVVAASGSSVGHTVGASSSVARAARAGGSEQLPGAAQRRFSKWPTGINLIYGDWIEDLE